MLKFRIIQWRLKRDRTRRIMKLQSQVCFKLNFPERFCV